MACNIDSFTFLISEKCFRHHLFVKPVEIAFISQKKFTPTAIFTTSFALNAVSFCFFISVTVFASPMAKKFEKRKIKTSLFRARFAVLRRLLQRKERQMTGWDGLNTRDEHYDEHEINAAYDKPNRALKESG